MGMCVLGIHMAYAGMNDVEIMEKIANTDLRETCGYVSVRPFNDESKNNQKILP